MQVAWKVTSKESTIQLQGNETWQQEQLHIHINTSSFVLGDVVANLKVPVDKGEKIFMNGYQTWTKSSELGIRGYTRGLNKVPKNIVNKYSFDRYGDYHFVKYPERKGVMHGVISAITIAIDYLPHWMKIQAIRYFSMMHANRN